MVAREDLPLGTLIAQIVHAAGESSTGDLDPGTYAVALAARNEAHLLELAAELTRRSISFKLIEEPSAPWNGAAMAIGVSPTHDRKPIQRALGRLPLIRRCADMQAA